MVPSGERVLHVVGEADLVATESTILRLEISGVDDEVFDVHRSLDEAVHASSTSG
jgi:hypothetical protein